MSQRQRQWLGFLLVAILCCLLSSPTFADTLTSPHYQFSESTLGAGGLPNSASTNYKGSSSTGDIGVGKSSSTNFGVQGGSQTTPFPTLSVTVNSTSVAFSNFSASTPVMGTATFSVINYTSYGYVVEVTGTPLTNNSGGHQISPMTTATTSSPGFEQYGMNLVANTAPQSIGANPVQVPSAQFSYGVAATGYSTVNSYQYNNGDTIASAPKSSGQTNYTISYLVNISALTPGGQYSGNQSLVVVGTY